MEDLYKVNPYIINTFSKPAEAIKVVTYIIDVPATNIDKDTKY
jgi:hypothetical protein